jgi:hypothetical protein
VPVLANARIATLKSVKVAGIEVKVIEAAALLKVVVAILS